MISASFVEQRDFCNCHFLGVKSGTYTVVDASSVHLGSVVGSVRHSIEYRISVVQIDSTVLKMQPGSGGGISKRLEFKLLKG